MTILPLLISLLPPPIPPIDADSLVALNDALRFTPVEELRDVIRSVCLSNLDVAAVLYGALCGGRDGEGEEGDGVSSEDEDDDDEDEDDDEEDEDDDDEDEDDDDEDEDDDDEDEDEDEEDEDQEQEYWEDEREERRWDYERGSSYEEGEEDDDDDNEEEKDTEDQNGDNGVWKAAVVDLTGPASDKENTGVDGKRKAVDLPGDNPMGQAVKKRKAVAGTEQIHFKDRYRHCSNCYELFDLMATPCHDHKNGPKQTSGPRERMGGENYSGGDNAENENETNEENIREEVGCECVYHPGYLEADYDSTQWDDHDENCHGVIDSDFCRTEYPDGFIWDCCDQKGSANGCKMGRHDASSRKKQFAELNMGGR